MKHLILLLLVAFLAFLLGAFGVSLTNVPIFHEQKTDLNGQQSDEGLADTRESDWVKFKSFENKDLSSLDSTTGRDLQNAVSRLVRPKTGYGDLRLISQISNERGERYYILIGEKPLVTIPGGCGLFVHLFDQMGRDVAPTYFDSGYRISLGEIRVRTVPEIGREVIEVDSKPEINGRDIFKQFYALVDDKILAIRLEDKNGKAARNYYEFPNMTIGPIVTGRSAGEWVRMVESNDPAEILTSLMWLSGVHLDTTQARPDYSWTQMEDFGEAEMVRRTRLSKEFKKLLPALLRSENKWMREAAELISKTEVQKYEAMLRPGYEEPNNRLRKTHLNDLPQSCDAVS